MNNLHQELAPASDSAWAQTKDETARTLVSASELLTARVSISIPT
jgi:hypothetical protein